MELRRFFRAPLLLIAVAVLLLLFVLDYANSGSSYKQVDTSQIVTAIDQGQVKSALIVDKNQTIQITTKSGQNLEASWVSGQGLQLQNKLQQQVDKGNLKDGYNVNIPKSNALLDLIPTALIYLVIFLLFFFMLSQMQGGGSRVMNFGKSKAKLITKDTPKTTFADVAGADEAIEELQEIKEFLQSPAKFQAIGAKIPKGVLLYGPPGTGKTLLARAVAGEAGVPFYSISGSDFVEMFVGVGASRVRDLFEQAKANAPAIVFVDEIDAVGRHRGAGLGGGHDEREQTLNQMLVELDGFDTKGGVIVIAATNRPDILDPALLRPGRFDRQIVVAQPDLAGRKGILKVHARGKPIAPDADLDIIARRTPGFTGADLANVINEGALLTARANGKQITHGRARGGHRPGHGRPGAQERAAVREGAQGHRLPRGRPRPGRPRHAARRPGAQGDDHPARPGARLHQRAADRGQVPGHPGRDARPAGHAARRPHRRGADLPRADHRRGQRHREGHPDRPRHDHRVRHERAAGRAQVRQRRRRAVPGPGHVAQPGLLRRDRLLDRRGDPPADRVGARRGVGGPGPVPRRARRAGAPAAGQGDRGQDRGARDLRHGGEAAGPRLVHRPRQAAALGPPAGPLAQGARPGRGGRRRGSNGNMALPANGQSFGFTPSDTEPSDTE